MIGAATIRKSLEARKDEIHRANRSCGEYWTPRRFPKMERTLFPPILRKNTLKWEPK